MIQRLEVCAGGRLILVHLRPSGHADDHLTYLIDAATMTRRWQGKDAYDSRCDPSGERFAVIFGDGRVESYDTHRFVRRSSFKVKAPFAGRIAFVGRGQLAYASGRELVVVDGDSGARLASHSMPHSPYFVESLHAAANGSWVALSLLEQDASKRVLLVELRAQGRRCLVGEASDAELSADGRYFAALHRDTVAVGETRSCALATALPGMTYEAPRFGGQILVVGQRHTLHYFDPATGGKLAAERLPRPVGRLAIDVASRTVVLAGEQDRPIGGALKHSYWFGPVAVQLLWKHRWPGLARAGPGGATSRPAGVGERE